MAVRGCPFEVPSDPAALQGAPPTRPPNLPAWGVENVTSLTHSHRIHFSPTNYSADGWKSAIIASQHPLHCERFLLVEDDMNNSGIGFTAKVWSFALLLAVRTRRVLLEVPRASGRSRWCDRPPYSFQCLYEPWTHCSPPPANITAFVPKGRPMTLAWPKNAPVIRTGLGRINRQGRIWHSARHSPVTVASKFLFRPRSWLRRIGDCVMQKAGLQTNKFFSIHIRHSVEKSLETKKLSAPLPVLQAYHPLAKALSVDLGMQNVFVQTASPVGLAEFASFAHENHLNISYTDNPRSEHDTWGGWILGAEMLQAVVGAVNAYVSTHAAVIASPGCSVWTDFLHRSTTTVHGMKEDRIIHIRCPPSFARASWFGIFGPLAYGPLPSLRSACKFYEHELV